MSARPDLFFNDDVLRSLIDRLSPSDRQTMLGMCNACELVLEFRRTALVQELQHRAARASSALAIVEGEGENPTAMLRDGQTRVEEPGEVWHWRLEGFLRRRMVEPVREQGEHARKSPLNPSPQSAWHSTSPTTPEPLMDTQTRRAMRDWTEQRIPLLFGGPNVPLRLMALLITEEDVQDEVRRQVLAALENCDQQVKDLQSENVELRQPVKAALEGSDELERVAEAQQRSEREGRAGPRVPEDAGTPRGVRSNAESRQGELPRAPALPAFGSRGDVGNPLGLEVQSRGDFGNPPGLEVRSRGLLWDLSGQPVQYAERNL